MGIPTVNDDDDNDVVALARQCHRCHRHHPRLACPLLTLVLTRLTMRQRRCDNAMMTTLLPSHDNAIIVVTPVLACPRPRPSSPDDMMT